MFLASQIFRIFVSAQYLLYLPPFPFYLRFPIFPPSRFLEKGPLLSSSFAILIIFPHFSPERSDFSQSLRPLPPLRPSAHILYRISTQSNSLFPPFLRGRLRIRQFLSKNVFPIRIRPSFLWSIPPPAPHICLLLYLSPLSPPSSGTRENGILLLLLLLFPHLFLKIPLCSWALAFARPCTFPPPFPVPSAIRSKLRPSSLLSLPSSSERRRRRKSNLPCFPRSRPRCPSWDGRAAGQGPTDGLFGRDRGRRRERPASVKSVGGRGKVCPSMKRNLRVDAIGPPKRDIFSSILILAFLCFTFSRELTKKKHFNVSLLPRPQDGK